MTKNAIAFFTDRAMLPGLHTALSSLLASNPCLNADVFIFSDGLSTKDVAHLMETWATAKPDRPLTIRKFSPKALGNTLHGNATAYGRLFLGDLLPDYNRCAYLDCDIIVNASLQDLIDLLPDGVLLSADCTDDRRRSLDKQLFIDAGLDLDGSCFNSGVLVINLDIWRTSNAIGRCHDVAARFEGKFKSADQALLNVAFHEQVYPFGIQYNFPLYTSTESPRSLDNKIYHFVGSPKPWDLFGSKLHNSHSVWRKFYLDSAIGGSSTVSYLSARRIIRTLPQLVYSVKKRIRRKLVYSVKKLITKP